MPPCIHPYTFISICMHACMHGCIHKKNVRQRAHILHFKWNESLHSLLFNFQIYFLESRVCHAVCMSVCIDTRTYACMHRILACAYAYSCAYAVYVNLILLLSNIIYLYSSFTKNKKNGEKSKARQGNGITLHKYSKKYNNNKTQNSIHERNKKKVPFPRAYLFVYFTSSPHPASRAR